MAKRKSKYLSKVTLISDEISFHYTKDSKEAIKV